MMRCVGWIRVLSLVCAGLGAAPVVAQRGTDSRGGSTAQRQYRQQPALQQRQATASKATAAAAAPRTMMVERPPSAATGPVRAQASLPGRAPVSTQVSIPSKQISMPSTQAATPGMMIDRPPVLSGRRPQGPTQTTPAQSPTQGVPAQLPPYSSGRLNGSPATGASSSPTATGPAQQQPQPPVATYSETVPGRQSTGQPAPVPKPRVPPRTPPPIQVTHNPPRWPRVLLQTPPPPIVPARGLPVLPLPVTTPYPPVRGPSQSVSVPSPSSVPPPQPAPPTSQAVAQPSSSGGGSSRPAAGQPQSQPQSRQSRSTAPTQRATGGREGGVIAVPPIVPALTLTAKTNRPVVGKEVEVVAALEPAQAGLGAKYQLNWGDGSTVETVSGRATHRYVKAKTYKVSASAVAGRSELHHEILLQVGPVVWPRVVGLMAVLAGLTFFGLHLPAGPKLSVSSRWGEPDLPEMTLLTREPYASLSFEPGLGPEEESITFMSKGR